MKLFFKIAAANIVAISIIVLLLFVVISWTLNSSTRHGEALTVPDIKGLTINDAIRILEAKKLKFLITDSLYFEDQPKNAVLEQNPSPQSKVKEGRIIYLTLNSNKAPLVNMPNLIDVSLRQAQAMLQSAGLKSGRLIYKPDIAQNVVLEQQANGRAIAAGTKIPKGSTIDLVLGDGLTQGDVALPNIIGLTLQEASNLLSSSSLNIGSVVYQGNIADSTNAKVYKQHPMYADGLMISAGQTVDLFLRQE
jgi:eukaryotic-like serine/threonine-protein kinase